MDKINELREQIDIIDRKIMELLEKRYTISKEIGELKQQLKTTVLDQNRENIILNKASKYSHSPQIELVYKTIMSESRKLQRK